MPRQNIQDQDIFNPKDDSVSSNSDLSLDDQMENLAYKTRSVLEKANHALHREDAQPGIRWTKEKNAMIRQSIKSLEPDQIDHFLDKIERIQAKNRNNQAQWNKPFKDVDSMIPTNQISTETSTPSRRRVKETKSVTDFEMHQPSIEGSNTLNRAKTKTGVNSSGHLQAVQCPDEQGIQSVTVKKPSAFTFFTTRGASSSTAAPRP